MYSGSCSRAKRAVVMKKNGVSTGLRCESAGNSIQRRLVASRGAIKRYRESCGGLKPPGKDFLAFRSQKGRYTWSDCCNDKKRRMNEINILLTCFQCTMG